MTQIAAGLRGRKTTLRPTIKARVRPPFVWRLLDRSNAADLAAPRGWIRVDPHVTDPSYS